MFLLEGAAQSLFDFSTIDLGTLVTTVTAAIGAGMATAVTIKGLKKGVNWFLSFIGKA